MQLLPPKASLPPHACLAFFLSFFLCFFFYPLLFFLFPRALRRSFSVAKAAAGVRTGMKKAWEFADDGGGGKLGEETQMHLRKTSGIDDKDLSNFQDHSNPIGSFLSSSSSGGGGRRKGKKVDTPDYGTVLPAPDVHSRPT